MSAISTARRARGLSLEQIARTTRLNLRYVQAIDEGRFAELPSGLYARAYVRAVAKTVELEPEALAEMLAALAPPPDPLPALQEAQRSREVPIPMLDDPRVYLAATIDAAVLLGVNTATVAFVAAACGLRLGALVAVTPVPLFVLCATTWALYFVLLGGIQGRTPGQQACGLASPRETAPLRLRDILQRAAGLERLKALLSGPEGESSARFEQPPQVHGAR
jgi:uncharacterized RDD family membrane protein YckC